MTKSSDDHLDPLALARRLSESDTGHGGDLDNFVAHLATGCPRCSKTLLELTEALDERLDLATDRDDSELTRRFEEALQDSGALDRARETALAHRARAETRTANTVKKSVDSAGHRDSGKDLISPKALLGRAKDTWAQNPKLSRSLIMLALELCDQISVEPFEGAVHDLQSRGWAYLANCFRLMDDFPAANEALERAMSFSSLGSKNPLVRAEVLNLGSSLLQDERRLGEASEFLDEMAVIYQEAGDQHLAGRTMLSQSNLASLRGQTDLALELLEKAGERIDFERDPHLEGIIVHNIMTFLADTDRGQEAQTLMEENRAIYDQPSNVIIRLRLPWVEGKIALSLGALDEAEDKLRQAQLIFLDRETPTTWAMASLDLAVVLARQERWAELVTLAHSMLETFKTFDLSQEGFAALRLLVQAAEGQVLTVKILRETAQVLQILPPLKLVPTS